MFNHRKEVTVELPAAPSVPTPLTIPEPSLGELEREEYANVAEEIGFASTALVSDKIRAYLRTRESRVYNLEQVERFLAQQAPKKDGYYSRVVWTALRHEDRKNPGWWYQERKYGKCIVGFEGRGYQRPVPLPAV